LHGLEGSPDGRHDAEESQRASINDGCVVDKDLEFAIPTMDHVNIFAQLSPESRRHTDGVNA
jgi:hypothetical protein